MIVKCRVVLLEASEKPKEIAPEFKISGELSIYLDGGRLPEEPEEFSADLREIMEVRGTPFLVYEASDLEEYSFDVYGIAKDFELLKFSPDTFGEYGEVSTFDDRMPSQEIENILTTFMGRRPVVVSFEFDGDELESSLVSVNAVFYKQEVLDDIT